MDINSINNDKCFIKGTSVTPLTESTKEMYRRAIKVFCEANNNKPFSQLISEMKEGEYGEIIGNKIKPYDVEESLTKEYLTNFKNYMMNVQQISNSSMRTRQTHLRTMLNNNNIILPKRFIFQNDNKKLYLLTRKDIQYIMSISTLHNKAMLSFGGSTGLRISDICRLTIGDFMLATQKYHNSYSVEEFIDKAPLDMIGYWELTPQKTQKKNIECKVCNSPESSNYILESLRSRVESINAMNKNTGKNEVLEFDDALFGSREKYYKGYLNTKSLSIYLARKNKVFHEKLKRDLENDLKNRKISLMEYKKKCEELPRFHPHALRHYFISVLNAYCSNKTIALKMEGHRGDIPIHKHYIGQSDELFDEDMIREHYEKLIPYLTFNKTIDVKQYLQFKENEKMLGEYQNRENEWIEKQNELNQKYVELSERLDKINKM